MPARATTSALILFFDCYIVASTIAPEDAYETRDPRVGDAIRAIRTGATAYRHVSKLDVVKYTLLSYLAVPWDEMILRVECETEADRDEFFAFARRHFPFASIVNERCATAAQFVAALSPLQRHGNPWVFFSPNNDHPLVGDPAAFGPLIALAEDIERLYPGRMVTIRNSHFTESQNTAQPDQHDWGQTGAHSTVLGETCNAHIVQQNRFVCDSIKVYRLDALLMVFSQATNLGRCIRLEDTGMYMSHDLTDIMIYPKEEICRHFDSYTHVINTTPPLFIPHGFFESEIKIRYGFPTREDGYVNVNPYEAYSFLGGAADLRCLLSELPPFWKSRIASVLVDPEMGTRYAERRDDGFQFSVLKNPYSESDTLVNYMRSAWNAYGQYHFNFDSDLLLTFQFTIPAGRAMIDRCSATTSAVYFVMWGVVKFEEKEFRKHDFIIIQGQAEYLLYAVGANARVFKVLIHIGGPSNQRTFSWREFNGKGSVDPVIAPLQAPAHQEHDRI